MEQKFFFMREKYEEERGGGFNVSNTKVTSILLGFIADCCVRLNKAGLNHLQVCGGYLRSWDHHRNLYIEVELSLPADCDPEVFELSIETNPQNTKLLRSVGKRGGDIQLERCGHEYLLKDDYSKPVIRKIESELITATVTDFVATLQVQGNALPAITGKGELSLNGNEPYVLLGIYGGQLSSLTLPNQHEQFFAPNSARQMQRKQRKIYKSYGFLKFGEPDFNVSVHKSHEELWLLTTGQFADDVPYRVLERLTPIL